MSFLDRVLSELDLKVGEPFKILDTHGYVDHKVQYIFRRNGMQYKMSNDEVWKDMNGSTTVIKLLEGEYKVAPKKFVPELGKIYWYVRLDIPLLTAGEAWMDHAIDKYRLENNLAFRTLEECVKQARKCLDTISKETK